MLYLVATPIGNLGDLSSRAIETLSAVDLIYCEDTRHTGLLLNHFGIKKPTRSLHMHNERERTEEVTEALKSGKDIAYVSDAGMPGVSDPGAMLVAACQKEGLPHTVIPGASAAVIAAHRLTRTNRALNVWLSEHAVRPLHRAGDPVFQRRIKRNTRNRIVLQILLLDLARHRMTHILSKYFSILGSASVVGQHLEYGYHVADRYAFPEKVGQYFLQYTVNPNITTQDRLRYILCLGTLYRLYSKY